MPRVFDKKNIILLRINENDINSFLVDTDINDQGQPEYQLDEFTKAIINTIPEYVYAQYIEPNDHQTDLVDKLRLAAKSIYKIKEVELMKRWYVDSDQAAYEQLNKAGYTSRGEFGELILHLLLRDFKETIPLVSKVYFKDAAGVPAHGFDAVHISPDEEILWLGESKFYTDCKQGLRELIKDLKCHFKKDYLDEQFTIIKKNLEVNNIPQRDEWIQILSNCNKLSDRIRIINIPVLCTYPHNIYSLYPEVNCEEAIEYHEANIRDMKRFFDEQNDHSLKSQLNVILLLFPVKDKHELVKKLHERLWHMQSM